MFADWLIKDVKEIIEGISSAIHEDGESESTSRNIFIRPKIIRQSLYNSDEEASKHDISTKTGKILAMLKL